VSSAGAAPRSPSQLRRQQLPGAEVTPIFHPSANRRDRGAASAQLRDLPVPPRARAGSPINTPGAQRRARGTLAGLRSRTRHAQSAARSAMLLAAALLGAMLLCGSLGKFGQVKKNRFLNFIYFFFTTLNSLCPDPAERRESPRRELLRGAAAGHGGAASEGGSGRVLRRAGRSRAPAAGVWR